MRKIVSIGMIMLLAGGCAWLQRDAETVLKNTEGPVVERNAPVQEGVKLVSVKPSDACVFKGGVLGDANPDEAGLPSSVFNLSQRIREGLISSAKHMGGNTVWLRTADWQNPDISSDYYHPFFVNNVEYSALVYDCPAE